MTEEKNLLPSSLEPKEGTGLPQQTSSEVKNRTSGNVKEALITEQKIFDDNHFAELLDNLEKSDCSDSERENFLNDMWKFNKLGIGSFNKLLLFCSYYNRKIDIDLLTKFSDMTYKELIRSVNCVDLEISDDRIRSKSLEKYLDTINCPYNNEAFNDFWNNSSYEPENIFRISKRHDLSVKNLNRGYYRYNSIHFRNIVKLKEPIRPIEIDYEKLKLFLNMFRQEEINENTILAIIGDCGRTDACTFAIVPQILKEYKLDYYKFCEYFFLDKEANKYDFGKIKEYREYFERNNIPSYIPNDLEDKLKECESLTKMEPKDIIEYCENYEIIGGENIEYPIRNKFIIMFNPVDKKLSCVLGSVKAFHRDLGSFGNIILGGGYFKTVTPGSYMLKGYSEEFGGFYGYENWLSKIISLKTGLRYKGYGGNNNKEYLDFDEEERLLAWHCEERMGYGKYHFRHP